MERQQSTYVDSSASGASAGKARDRGIDALRGLAILLMIMANSAPYTLAPPFPLWFRFISSLAAPLFVTLAGLMVAFTSGAKGYGIGRFWFRAALVAGTGVLLDLLVYGMIPGTSFDILYLIAVSLPVAYLAGRAGRLVPWVLAGAIFALTPLLQATLGYTPDPTEIYFLKQGPEMLPVETGIVQHVLVDGWFPLFPWLGFALLGVGLAELRKLGVLRRLPTLLSGVVLSALGLLVWTQFPGALMERCGFVELFYPPTIGFIATVSGTMAVLFWIVSRFPPPTLLDPLYALGEASITVYVFHLTLITYVVEIFWEDPGGSANFLVHSLWLTAACLALGYGLRACRKRYKFRSQIVKFFVGG